MLELGGFNFGSGSGTLRRFHFDLENGAEVVEDREGVNATDLDEALTQARAVIAEMRDEDDLAEPGVWTLAIRGRNGVILKRLTVE